MKHVFLLDLTRHDGPVQGAVSPAQAYVSTYSPEIVRWYVTPSQKLQMSDSKTDCFMFSRMRATFCWMLRP